MRQNEQKLPLTAPAGARRSTATHTGRLCDMMATPRLDQPSTAENQITLLAFDALERIVTKSGTDVTDITMLVRQRGMLDDHGNLDGGGGTHPGALGHVRRDKQRQRFSGRDGERVVAAEGKERTDDVRGPRGSRVAGEVRARGGVVLDVGWGEVSGRGGG